MREQLDKSDDLELNTSRLQTSTHHFTLSRSQLRGGDPQMSISVLRYQKTDVNRNIAEYNRNHAAGKSSLAPKPPRVLTKMCRQKKCARDLTKICPRRNALQSTLYLVAMAATRYKNGFKVFVYLLLK